MTSLMDFSLFLSKFYIALVENRKRHDQLFHYYIMVARAWYLKISKEGTRLINYGTPMLWVLFSYEVKVAQSCPTLCNPMDYTVRGILQARILEWVAFPFSRGLSQPRDQIQVTCIAGGFFTSWATREAQFSYEKKLKIISSTYLLAKNNVEKTMWNILLFKEGMKKYEYMCI